MIHPTNYPLPKPTHQIHQSLHSNPPPKQKIISSKDQAIHQLIYENTMLKKQLSQLMLKTTAPTQFVNLNAVESAMTSVRPSVSHLGSYRNSLQNSMEFGPNPMCVKVNNLADNVCQGKSQKQEKMVLQRQNKHAYRHSVDNFCYGYEGQFHPQINQPQQNRPLFGQNENQLKNSIPLVVNQRQTRFQTNQNFANTMPSFKQQQSCMIEQEMYREKMIKLKGRRTSQSKRLSEEKPMNKPVCHPNRVIVVNQNATTKVPQVQQFKKIENSQSYKSQNQSIHGVQIQSKLIKIHQVLKSKLNSPQFSPTLKSQAKESIPQKNLSNQTFQNSIPLTHDKLHTQQKKIIPKYTPKNFSQQKQNKTQLEQKKVLIPSANQQNSVKTVQRKQTEASSQQASRQNIKQKAPAQNEPKKVCLRQLRGRVYLDDQGQGGRTKRAVSKNNSNITSQKSNNKVNESNETQDQTTKRNHTKQSKQQVPKRINSVESQMAYVDAESFRRLNTADKGFPCTEKIVMNKKNSNKVYLEEDEGDKHNFKTMIKNKQQKVTNNLNPFQKANKIEVEIDNLEELVSIEEIHMINEKNQIFKSSIKQPVQTHKRNSSLSRQNSVQNQLSRNKNLYNQMYCEESKKDLHS